MKTNRISIYVSVTVATVGMEILATMVLRNVWNFGGDIDRRILISAVLAAIFSPGLTLALLDSQKKAGPHWGRYAVSGLAFQYALAYAGLLIIVFPDVSSSVHGIRDILFGLPGLALGAIIRVLFFPPFALIGLGIGLSNGFLVDRICGKATSE